MAVFALFFCSPAWLVCQQPQAPAGTPLYAVNAKYVNGLAPGYWPTAGSGLTLNLSSGTAYCGNPPASVTYVGGTLTLSASATNYVYLDPAANCAPTANTSGFYAGDIPIAKVVTGASAITSVADLRTWSSPNPAAVSGSGAVQISALGTNQNITLAPSGTGASVVTNLADKGGQVFNVKAYGAKGDGTTDDTAAIQAAIDAAGAAHGIVYLPPGTYDVSSTLEWPSSGADPVVLMGSGPSAGASNTQTVIKATAALSPILDVRDDFSRIENVYVNGNNLATLGIEMHTARVYAAGHASNEQLRNVKISKITSTGTGLDLGSSDALQGCSDCRFWNVGVFGNGGGTGIKIAREENQFYNIQVVGETTGVDFLGGTNFGGPSGNGFFGGVFSGNGTDLTTEATTISNSFYSVWFEDSTNAIIGNIPSGSYVDQRFNFFGCTLNTASTSQMMDLTNMVGTVSAWGTDFDVSSTGLIITNNVGWFRSYSSSFTNGLSFSGTAYSINGGGESGSVALNTTAVPSGGCQQASNQTGLAGVGPNSVISFSPTISSGLLIEATTASSELDLWYCNYTGSTVTPSARTVHWKVAN